jgi:hypothetical protein
VDSRWNHLYPDLLHIYEKLMKFGLRIQLKDENRS